MIHNFFKPYFFQSKFGQKPNQKFFQNRVFVENRLKLESVCQKSKLFK